jgi:Outer membrane protein beta-barrel domain
MKITLVMIILGILVPVFLSADQFQFGLGIDTSLLSYNQNEIDGSRVFWGGHARVRVMKYLAGEVTVQKRQDNFNIRSGSIKLDTVPVQLSGIVYPLAMLPVSPYFVAGTGWYYLTATITGDLDLPYVTGEGTIHHTENAFHIGVGVEAFIGNHVSVGGDIRKVFLEFNTPVIRYKVDAYLVNAGATFYF